MQLNGRSLGRRRCGAATGFLTKFSTPYEKGELTAIAYRHGQEIGRSSLRSAGSPRLSLRPEAEHVSGPDDLCFVWVELADEEGIVDVVDDDRVRISVSGPAELLSLASAAPSTRESFVDDEHHTYRGRALAVVRATGEPGTITLHATSDRHGVATTTLEALSDQPRDHRAASALSTKEQA